jgi:hypothetical protein
VAFGQLDECLTGSSPGIGCYGPYSPTVTRKLSAGVFDTRFSCQWPQHLGSGILKTMTVDAHVTVSVVTCSIERGVLRVRAHLSSGTGEQQDANSEIQRVEPAVVSEEGCDALPTSSGDDGVPGVVLVVLAVETDATLHRWSSSRMVAPARLHSQRLVKHRVMCVA